MSEAEEQETREKYWDACNALRDLINEGKMSKEEIMEQLEDDL